jgi:hypothetical protein
VLAIYLVTAVVGGVMVGFSLIGGGDHDTDAGLHGDGGEVGEVDGGLHAEAEAHGQAHGAHSPFLPFLSPRFWFFAACFFGLTGLALTYLAGVGEPVAGLVSGSVGAGAGLGASALVRSLRQPVGSTRTAESWVGRVGELVHALDVGQVSKIVVLHDGGPGSKVRSGHEARRSGAGRELLAVLAEGGTRLPRGARVVVLAMREGRAVVALEGDLLGARGARLGLDERVRRTHEEES